MLPFTKFNKIPRLSRDITITEKLDGTSAKIYICPKDNLKSYLYQDINSYISEEFKENYCLYENEDSLLFAGSRKRWLKIGDDNFAFAHYVKENGQELIKLGEGTHFGEWYGRGIQRNYGLDHKRFALFNVGKWVDSKSNKPIEVDSNQEYAPKCCEVVPFLYKGEFCTQTIEGILGMLKAFGSVAVPGFMKSEGIIIFHTASGKLFKKTCENDEKPKGK